MTYRTKAGLRNRMAVLFPDNDSEEISAADLREFLGDLVDSARRDVRRKPVWCLFWAEATPPAAFGADFPAGGEDVRAQGVRLSDVGFIATWPDAVPVHPPARSAAERGFWVLLVPRTWVVSGQYPRWASGTELRFIVLAEAFDAQVGNEPYAVCMSPWALLLSAAAGQPIRVQAEPEG